MRFSAPRCFRFGVLPGMLIGIICIAFSPRTAAATPPTFDPKPWIEDLEQVKESLATKYANLEWVVFEHEIDLTALFDETKARIESSSSETEARASLDRLARKLGDGHVRFRWSVDHSSSVPNASCKALGYDPQMQGQPVAALMPGYSPLAKTSANEFPAGLVQVAGHKVGVLKIGLFSPLGYPELCTAAMVALKIRPNAPCNDECSDQIEAWAMDRMTSDLASQLNAFKAAGAEALLVDVAGNGGGTEWAEVAARMVTAARLKSERIAFVRGSHWANKFAKKEVELRAAARTAKGEDRTLLTNLANQVEIRRHEAETRCDSNPFWSGERPVCRWLGDAFYSSGLLESNSDQLRGKPWASLVFQPARFNYSEGIWSGPLIVLMDGGTGSAAAQFAAVLQDNHAAVLMGLPANGGCGHTDGGTPTILKNSGGVFELPDCARLRTDGTNEVMGVQPAVLVDLAPADGPLRQGTKVFDKLPEVIRLAPQATPSLAVP
jgi:hypothetical protein